MQTKQDPETTLIGTICQPKPRWQKLAVAMHKRFGCEVETAEWKNHGGWMMANISVRGALAKSTLRDIRMWAEGFLAADGGQFEAQDDVRQTHYRPIDGTGISVRVK